MWAPDSACEWEQLLIPLSLQLSIAQPKNDKHTHSSHNWGKGGAWWVKQTTRGARAYQSSLHLRVSVGQGFEYVKRIHAQTWSAKGFKVI